MYDTTRLSIGCGVGRCSPRMAPPNLAVKHLFDAETVWFSELN